MPTRVIDREDKRRLKHEAKAHKRTKPRYRKHDYGKVAAQVEDSKLARLSSTARKQST